MAFESVARDARIDIGVALGALARRLPRILIVTAVLLGATYVVLMFMPRLYESSASILVEPRSNVYLRSANEQAPSGTGGEAGVVSSQIELIKSRDTLLRVIDELELRAVPEFNGAGDGSLSPLATLMRLLGRSAGGPSNLNEVVLNNLYDRLTVIQERDSRIISVLVRSTDPQRAADIANAVANAHVARRAELSLADTAEASGWLLEEIERLRVSVVEAETAVANFRVDRDLFVGTNNTSLLDQQLSTIANQINAAQERKNAALTRATLIRSMMDQGQSIEGISDIRNSVAVQQLSQEKGRLQGELAQRSATLLPNHPTIRALSAQIAELDSQIIAEGRRVASAIEAEAEVEAGIEASLREDLSNLKASASTATQDTVTLDSLQREARAQRDLLESYLLRYNEATSRTESQSALPDVRVVSVAAPSVVAASPKSSLILMAVGIVSIVVQVGAVVFGELMSGRALAPIADPRRDRPQDEHDSMPFEGGELGPDQDWEAPAQKLDAEPDHYRAVTTEPLTSERTPVQPMALTAPRRARQRLVRDEPDLPEVIHLPQAAAVTQDQMPFVEEEFPTDEAAPTYEDYYLAPGVEPEPSEAAELQEQPVPEVTDEAAASTPAAEVASDYREDPVIADEDEEQADSGETELAGLLTVHDLTADLLLGRTHLLLLAGSGSASSVEALAEDLAGEALGRGLSVAMIDAGSGRRTEEAGLTDLGRGSVSFGDVVHKSSDNSFAEVPWGRLGNLDLESTRPLTLIEALGDVYEVVIVKTGVLGPGTPLSVLAELGGRLVLVPGSNEDLSALDRARTELGDVGFDAVEIAMPPTRAAA